jgi:hypothetical protein
LSLSSSCYQIYNNKNQNNVKFIFKIYLVLKNNYPNITSLSYGMPMSSCYTNF